jgi:hypothetical protein
MMSHLRTQARIFHNTTAIGACTDVNATDLAEEPCGATHSEDDDQEKKKRAPVNDERGIRGALSSVATPIAPTEEKSLRDPSRGGGESWAAAAACCWHFGLPPVRARNWQRGRPCLLPQHRGSLGAELDRTRHMSATPPTSAADPRTQLLILTKATSSANTAGNVRIKIK